MHEYMDAIEAPEHLFLADPRMRIPDDPVRYRTVVLPNVDALRSDPPDAGTMETLLGCFDEADPDQKALWPGQSRFATAKMLATKGVERTAGELVSLSLVRLANRHGRVVDPLLKLVHQVTAFDPDPAQFVGVGVVLPPVVLVRNRLVIDSTTVPLVPPRVLDAALFQMALGLFVRATQRVELLTTPNTVIGGKPAARVAVLTATMAQVQDMMAKLGVPQMFGTVYGYRTLPDDTPEVLHFAIDTDISMGVTWDEPFPSAYAKVYDRVPTESDVSGGQDNQHSSQQQGGGEQSSPSGHGDDDGDDQSQGQASSSQGRGQNQGDDQSQSQGQGSGGGEGQSDGDPGDGDPSGGGSNGGGDDQPRPVAASVMDQQTADQLFGRTKAPAGDITPSDAERAEIAEDLARKFIGTEPASLLREIARSKPKYEREPTLGDVVREWAETVSSRVVGDQLSPLRWSDAAWRRYGLWQPAQSTPVLGDVAVVLDTSGSIGAKELAQLASAVQEICTVGQPSSLRVIACDTAAHDVAIFGPEHIPTLGAEQTWLDLIGDRSKRIIGGGGTDMMVGINAALEPPKGLDFDDEFGSAYATMPQLVIVLTDGYTPWADTPPPVRVVVATTDRPGPKWATTVKLATR
jgi:uncharacterized membrane protein YgcG